MRLPSFLHRRSELELQMTPMIDVIFLLMIFFIWTASFQLVEEVLPTQLSAPQAGSTPTPQPPPPEADFDQVVVRIFWQGGQPRWELNEQPLDSLQQLRTQLQTIASIKRDAPVILHPDSAVPLGHVIDAYDVSRMSGFEKVQFAASEEI